jgi:hypothetical protein
MPTKTRRSAGAPASKPARTAAKKTQAKAASARTAASKKTRTTRSPQVRASQKSTDSLLRPGKLFNKVQLSMSAALSLLAITGGVWGGVVSMVQADNVSTTYNDPAYSYSGSWQTKATPKAYNSDAHISNTAGSIAKLTFTGTQTKMYTEKSPRMGTMSISVDGGPAKEIDLYAKTTSQQALVYTSPVLINKKHTFTIKVTGKKNKAATNTWVAMDKVVLTRVVAKPAPAPTPSPAPTTPAPTVPAPSASNSYYVATNGNDAAAGSASAPWKTIQKAVNTAPSGSTILVKAGTYAPFTVSRSGLIVRNNGSDKVIVKATSSTKYTVGVTASNTTVMGMTATGCVPDASLERANVYVGSTTGVKVLNMVVSEGTGKNAQGLPYGCYGISMVGANSYTLSGNEIFHNGSGIDISGGSQNAQILNNKIHDNNVIIMNTKGGNDDYGAVGITFANVNANPGPLAQGNTVYNNVGPSQDYGTDGGGFEIYKSSNVRMIGNTLYNNDGIFESGTDSGVACANNVFSGNTASGRTSGSTLKASVGMILRCSKNMTIANNTLGPVDSWMFDIEMGGDYGGTVDGLAITNNKIAMSANTAIYAMEINPSGHSFNFGGNQYKYSNFAWGWNNNTLKTLSDWQKATGLDKTSTTF